MVKNGKGILRKEKQLLQDSENSGNEGSETRLQTQKGEKERFQEIMDNED